MTGEDDWKMGKTAGRYDPVRGKIIDPIWNMKRKDDLDAYGTLVHEAQHVHFNHLTLIGGIIEMLGFELKCTPENDQGHRKKIESRIQILSEAMTELQEIYANSVELLWVEEYQGMEQAERVYARKVKGYKDYMILLFEILTDCKTLEEKRIRIRELCVAASDPDMTPKELVKLLDNEIKLREHFFPKSRENGDVYLCSRMGENLERVAEQYKKSGKIPGKRDSIGLWEITPLLQQAGYFIYSWELIQISRGIVGKMSRSELSHMIETTYQDMVIGKTLVFDFQTASRSARIIHEKWDQELFCVIKRYEDLICPEEDYFVLGNSAAGGYIGQEISEKELREAFRGAKALAVDFEEFDNNSGKPRYFSVGKIPLFVLLTDFHQCKDLLSDMLDQDLFIVDLFPEEIPNFYTVLFFRKRKTPGVIFVFPALKYLVRCLTDELDIGERMMLSQGKAALKVFSVFGDERRMLEAIQWIFSFVSGTEWDGGNGRKASSMLSSGFVRALLDSALEFHAKDYWKDFSALPTKDTCSDGFYTLMRFKGQENSGELCAQDRGGEMIPVLFRDKRAAGEYKAVMKKEEEMEIVAVDDLYWETLSAFLNKKSGKWILYMNRTQGILLDTDVYEQAKELCGKMNL